MGMGAKEKSWHTEYVRGRCFYYGESMYDDETVQL